MKAVLTSGLEDKENRSTLQAVKDGDTQRKWSKNRYKKAVVTCG